MVSRSEPTRKFRVHARYEDVRHGRIMIEPSFEAAALAYVEHLPVHADDHHGIGVIVHDVDSGHEHSFVIHVDSGEVAAS